MSSQTTLVRVVAVKAQASLAFARLTAAFSFPISPFTFHCPAPTVACPLALCFFQSPTPCGYSLLAKRESFFCFRGPVIPTLPEGALPLYCPPVLGGREACLGGGAVRVMFFRSASCHVERSRNIFLFARKADTACRVPTGGKSPLSSHTRAHTRTVRQSAHSN